VYAVAEWDSERLLGTMQWGFIPHWAKDRKGMQINARAETVASKPMFRDSFRRKRCLIPANGFYEWEPKDRGRTPHFVYRADGYPMGFAGLWSTWKDPETGEFIRTTTIITTDAKGVIAGIHERTPLVLDPSVWDAWLARDLTDPEAIEHLLQPIDDEIIAEHAVDSDVNSVRNNRPDLTAPAKVQRLL
jgi:putative SOS response-associated peptidase YedK